MQKNLEKFCLAIIRWGSYLILFLPLLVYRYTLFPYIFPKIIALQVLIEIIFTIWLFLIISEKKYRPNFKNPLILTLTIFMGILVLTMLTGVDISRSFLGTIERMTGVLTMFHFYLWFLVLASVFQDWRDWRKFIFVSLFTSFLVGLYGLGQKLGFQFLLKEADIIRLSSTLGNPIFLSVYAMLHIFLAGFLVLIEKKRFLKIISIFLLIFNLIIMLLGASRGVILAFGFSLFLFFLFLIFVLSYNTEGDISSKARYKKIKIILFFLIVIALGIGIFLPTQKDKDWVQKAPFFIQRIVYLEAAVWERTTPWQIAYQGFKERPIFGWGWENFNIIFNKYYHPRFLESGFAVTWYDRSHNQVMDILTLTGLLGIISYFVVFFFLFKLLYKKIRKNSETTLSSRISVGILGLMFLAYFVQNLTVFDTPAPLIVFYFSLSLVYFVTKNSQESLEEKPKRNQNKGIASLVLILIIIFLPLVIYKFNLKPFWQSKLAYKGANTSLTDLKTGLIFYQKALEKSTFANPEIRLQLLKSVMTAREKTDQITFREGLEFTILEMEKSIKEHPLDVRYHLYLGKFYNLAASFDKSYLEKAEKTLERALELSPQRQEVYYDLGLTKMMLKKNDQAITILEKVVSLNENIKESHWYLGLALLNAKKYEDGLKEIEKTIEMGWRCYDDNPNNVLFIAQAYAEILDYNMAIALCDCVLNWLDSQNLTAMAHKVVYLTKSGNKNEALKLIEEISKINPVTAQELKKVIESL